MISGRLWRILRRRPRLVSGVIAGCVVLVILPRALTPEIRTIIAWDAGVVLYVGSAAFLFTTERHARMAQDAAAQQEGEWTVFGLTLAAIVMSFIAVVDAFSGIKDLPPNQRALRVALVVVTLIVSWLMAQTTFAFRYAHEYYQRKAGGADIDRGLEFPEEDKPDYLDFVYFALVLGMTFQVSDVQITSRKLRRLAAMQGLLSFLFNTIIVALTVNLAAGLL